MIYEHTKPLDTEPNCQRGAGMAEYALLLTLIAVALVIGFGNLATAIDAALDVVVAKFP